MKLHFQIAVALLLTGCGKPATQISQDIAIPGRDASGQTRTQEVPVSGYPHVVLNTSAGNIVIALYQDKAPITVGNFMAYVKAGHYNNTVFHRVIGNLLVQGGAYTPRYQLKPERSPITSEADHGLQNLRGTVAAARRANAPNSAGAQFFINVVDNPQFDSVVTSNSARHGYTVFGRVVAGMEIVDRLRTTPVTPRSGISDAAPIRPIIIHQIQPVTTQ
jgi:cyclophilin family peptidyl-prolyl cis-trans isomerase